MGLLVVFLSVCSFDTMGTGLERLAGQSSDLMLVCRVGDISLVLLLGIFCFVCVLYLCSLLMSDVMIVGGMVWELVWRLLREKDA